MSNNQIQPAEQTPSTLTGLLKEVNVQKRFTELLGKKAQGFITSIMQVTRESKLLAKADPKTILTAASTAAVLDLPIDPNLGFAYIIPYNVKDKRQPNGEWTYKVVAQFQMGYKGFIQLAQRSGQYHRINAIKVYANQFKRWDVLSECLEADFTIQGEGEVVGYAAYFRLQNGFEKTLYWTFEEAQSHGKRYSKAYGKYGNLWTDDHGQHAMGMKTVLKLILSKYGPMEIESAISKALNADQSVQAIEGDYQYPDNTNNGINIDAIDLEKEAKRVKDHIASSATLEDLKKVEKLVTVYSLEDDYDNRMLTLEEAAKNGKK
ncbi:MAG: recombinase RecT [Thiotrichales bacterium]